MNKSVVGPGDSGGGDHKKVNAPTMSPSDSGGGDHPWPWFSPSLLTRSDPGSGTSPWPFFKETQVSFPLSGDEFPVSVKNMPVMLRDLLNHPCRLISPRMKIAADEYRPDRVNIIVDENNCIIDIRFF